MSIKDTIKSSVYEKLGGGTSLSFGNICLIFIFALVLGAYLFFLYKRSCKAAFYSKDTNITIAGMPLIVATIMIAMQSNLIVSLGMVGALSIVRFRTAIKNPLDLLFLFWSISVGIICGVSLFTLACVLCGFMTLLIILLNYLPDKKSNSIIIIRSAKTLNVGDVVDILKDNSSYYKEKSRSIKNGITELLYEIKATDENALLSKLQEIEAVDSINYLSYDGQLRV